MEKKEPGIADEFFEMSKKEKPTSDIVKRVRRM